jgi:hypothetical protein
MRAEVARVASMFQSDAIYSAVRIDDDLMFKNLGGKLSDSDEVDKSARRRNFEEAIVLYEAAIESARRFGFQQYEAMSM